VGCNKGNATVSEERYFIVDRHKVRESMGIDMQIVQHLLNPVKSSNLRDAVCFMPQRNTAMCRNETTTMGSGTWDPETCSVPDLDVVVG
jgi:hypothetical protein